MADGGIIPLRWPDYVVFSIMLLLNVLLGLYHGCLKGGQNTTKKFLLADRKVFSLPVALTVFASFVSPVTLLGTPAEIYTYGVEYIVGVLQNFIMHPTIMILFVPVFFGLDIYTAYEYFQKRFGLPMRLLGASMFLLQNLFYVAIVIFTPALAINAVTDIDIWPLILISGAICTFYTTLGGLSAVIWTDAFMAIIIIGTSIAVIIMGSTTVGGFAYAWNVNAEAGRTDLFQFPFDPTERLTFPNLIIGNYFSALTLFGISNTAVQRFLAARTLNDARISILLNIPMTVGVVLICCLEGVVLYAFYNSPDESGEMRSPPNVTSPDQILIYFVSEQFGNIPCFQGLFISCIVAGALSTVSSGLNAMAAVTFVDIMKPFRAWRDGKRETKGKYSDVRDTNISKALIAIYGTLAMGFAFLCLELGTLVSLFNTLFGAVGGPLLGAFTLGMLWKRANTYGTFVGTVTGLMMGALVVIGSSVTAGREYMAGLFKLSFMWYATLTFFTTVIVSMILSEFFRWLDKERNAPEVDPMYLATFIRPKGYKFEARTFEDETDEVETLQMSYSKDL